MTVEAPQRTRLRGPTFVRLLAQITGSDTLPPGPLLADRLGQWIDWSRAVALARALDGPLPSAPESHDLSPQEDACARARDALTRSIHDTDKLDAAARQAQVDYAPFRQHYLTRQRTMQATTGKLRGELRDRLASTSRDLARLAELDAVMELALSAREQSLLGTVPEWLGQHFERLRLAELARRDTAIVRDLLPVSAPAVPATAWLDTFRADMRNVLLAELDLRFQPIEGLLAALRSQTQGCHA